MSDADLPHRSIVKPPRESTTEGETDAWKRIAGGLPVFQTTYDEGLKVGYKWYDAEKKQVLFPFDMGCPTRPTATPTCELHRVQCRRAKSA